MECLKCGASILEENATFCHECGARLDGKITCPKCGQFIDNKYAYCVFCGTKIDQNANKADCVMQKNGVFPACEKILTKKDEQPATNESGKAWNTVFAWMRTVVGMALALLSLVFVFMIGFQVDLTGQTVAFSEIGFDASQANIKLFYYFGDAYKEITELKEMIQVGWDTPILGAYIHAVMGTVISAATIACVVGFAIPAIINFIMFFITKVENNGRKWAVRSVIAYCAGCIALKVLNYCLVDINLVMPQRPSWGNPLNAIMTINFNIMTKLGLLLCIVGVALYAILNFIKKGKQWLNKKTVVNCVFSVLAATFAIVVFVFGQKASVGTLITLSAGSAQNLKFAITMSQLPFVTFLYSFFDGQFLFIEEYSKLDTSHAFAVVQEIMTLGIVVCSLCAIAARIFETEGKTKGTLLFAILTVVFSVAQLITGIVSHSVTHELYARAFGGGAVIMTTTLILGNSIITVVFAVLLLVTSIIHLTTKKMVKSCSSPQNEWLNND